ncbi:polysaccharide export protein [Stappia sp. F7233]|uniref:Polysaccharide export protein n=1 Tax=Stappia albiluteola TaxID=2758565 RepID=A0A839AA48_9HYPH|nr:polysaccharide export protein [Stappia albiluteola]
MFAPLLALLLAGCAALPGQGPSAISITADEIESGTTEANYATVTLDRNSARSIQSYRPVTFAQRFGEIGSRGRNSVLGVGDGLVIGIWEAAPDGLFSTATGKSVQVPTVIDQSGFIFIPYAGRIHADGLTVEGLRTAIEDKLKGKAIEPQVSVTVQNNASNSVVVVGDVAKPGQYPLSIRGSRLLELVAQAGGAREAVYETVVTLKRGHRSGTARFEDLIDYPENNIPLVSGDNILLSHKPRTYSAFGAVGQTTLVPFKTQTVTLAEALAQVGGLKDFFADAGGVFLFRYEDAALVRLLRPDLASSVSGETFPVVYRLNFREPQAFFTARAMEMRDKDVIYVANHPTAEFGKFLQLIGPLLSNVNTVNAISN